MKTLAALLIALVLLAPAAARAENKSLQGTYLKASCAVFNNADLGNVKMKDINDAFDKGLDAGFCSGFLMSLLNTNYALSQKNDQNHRPQFCPPQDLPVLDASRLLVHEMNRLPGDQLETERGLDLAVKIFSKSWPCGDVKAN